MQTAKKILASARKSQKELLKIKNQTIKNQKLRRREKILLREIEKTESIILCMPDEEMRAYLYARFIEMRGIENIAELFGVEERTVYRNINKATELLDKMILKK